MKYNLILVEGLPGTGKTTLSGRVFNLLTEQGIEAELLLEGNEKIPSNFCDIAGIPKGKNKNIKIDKSLIIETSNYVFVNMKNCVQDITSQIQCYDIGNEYNKFITAQEYARCTLEWWQNWAANNVYSHVMIMDSAFMQCPINEMIFRGASDSEAKSYIKTIAEIITPLNHICIYLHRESTEISINFAKAVKGRHWSEGIDKLAQSEFPDLFERRFVLESALLTTIPSVVCDINGYDWSDAELKIQKLFT